MGPTHGQNIIDARYAFVRQGHAATGDKLGKMRDLSGAGDRDYMFALMQDPGDCQRSGGNADIGCQFPEFGIVLQVRA